MKKELIKALKETNRVQEEHLDMFSDHLIKHAKENESSGMYFLSEKQFLSEYEKWQKLNSNLVLVKDFKFKVLNTLETKAYNAIYKTDLKPFSKAVFTKLEYLQVLNYVRDNETNN